MMDDVRNIGDAGDSSCDKIEDVEKESFPVTDMVYSIRQALQRGDHNILKQRLGTLTVWRCSPKVAIKHNYWRVAQYIGETELTNICVLLTVTSSKSDSIKWMYMDNVLAALYLALSNREVIFRLQAHVNSLTPILVEALNQDISESAAVHTLSIVSIGVIVCRARFAKALLNFHFLDKLVDRLVNQSPMKSLLVLNSVLELIKSLLMCGQAYIQTYCKEVLIKLLNVMNVLSRSDDSQEGAAVVQLYTELVKSLEEDDKAHVCAKYWTQGKLRKDLLSNHLGQPWLYLYCSWPACGCQNNSTSVFFRKCAACNVVRYCSRACQEKHWVAGHSSQCRRNSVVSGEGGTCQLTE